MRHPTRNIRSLRTQIAIVFGGLCATIAICLSLLAGELMKQRLQQQAAATLAMAAHNAASSLNAEIAQQSYRAQVLARSKELWNNDMHSQNVRSMLDRVQHITPRNVWIGVANTEGTVLNATQGMLQGSDASSQHWFQNGINGVYVSDVHPADMLTQLQNSPLQTTSLRVMDFSAPIYRADGSVAGVLGIQCNWDWVHDTIEHLLHDPNQTMQQALFIFDQQGSLIHAPAGLTSSYLALEQRLPLTTEEMQAARQAQPVQARWADRPEPYLTTVAQLSATSSDLGWWIVVRQPIETAYAGANRVLWLALSVGLLAALLAALLAWNLARHLSDDLKALAQAATRIRAGESNVDIPLADSNREVQQLSASLAHMTQKLLRANESMQKEVAMRTLELQEANAELRRQARTDPLTQILNRRGFTSLAQRMLVQAQRSGQQLCLLTLDIDYFKHINDTYGHDTGDMVLQQFAQTITQRMRQTDLVARFGGEEFVVLLPDTSLPAAMLQAEALRQSIAATRFLGTGQITTSIGISCLLGTQDSLAELLKRSDTALYQAKNTGRNRICSHTDTSRKTPMPGHTAHARTEVAATEQ